MVGLASQSQSESTATIRGNQVSCCQGEVGGQDFAEPGGERRAVLAGADRGAGGVEARAERCERQAAAMDGDKPPACFGEQELVGRGQGAKALAGHQ